MLFSQGQANQMTLENRANEATIAFKFSRVTLHPAIRKLDLELAKGDWAVLDGGDTLGIALFCDLCFGYLEPDAGSVGPRQNPSQVSFLGRSPSTYGATIWEHLVCGAGSVKRKNVSSVAGACLNHDLREQMQKGAQANLNPLHTAFSLLDLCERDLLEIAEANILLQNRPSVVIDTTSEFYREASAQGFKHSQLLLNGERNIFWIVDSTEPYLQAPWNEAPDGGRMIKRLLFPLESRLSGIN